MPSVHLNKQTWALALGSMRVRTTLCQGLSIRNEADYALSPASAPPGLPNGHSPFLPGFNLPDNGCELPEQWWTLDEWRGDAAMEDRRGQSRARWNRLETVQ